MNEKTWCILSNTGFGAILGGVAGTIGVGLPMVVLSLSLDIERYLLIFGIMVGLGVVFGFIAGLAPPMMDDEV